MESCEEACWRVAFEASASLKVLRVLLSRGEGETNPAEKCCKFVNARLLATRPPSLVCDWQTDSGQKVSLRVALPLCLVDQSTPVSVSVRTDHVEVRLKLLSVDGALLTTLLNENDIVGVKQQQLEERTSPLRLESDARLLASEEAVVLRCRSCSARLMKTPLHRFLELPSVDWQELSDNWYGGCCCEDKARARARARASGVLRFGGSLIPPPGTCLVGPSFCVVNASDVVGIDVAALTGPSSQVIREQPGEGGGEIPGLLWSELGGGGCGSFFHPQANLLPGDGDAADLNEMDEKDDKEDAATFCDDEVSYDDDRDDDVRHSHHCLVTNLWADDPPDRQPEPAWKGGGLEEGLEKATGTAQAPLQQGSKCGGWTRFLCYSCSALVGEVSELQQQQQQHGNPVHELRFLKYHISTDKNVGSRGDLFRRHTVERVVANQILSRVEGDATYRFLVRDRDAGTPLLQLVVLNQDQWICVPTKHLHPEMEMVGGGDSETRMGGGGNCCSAVGGPRGGPPQSQPQIICCNPSSRFGSVTAPA